MAADSEALPQRARLELIGKGSHRAPSSALASYREAIAPPCHTQGSVSV